MFPHEGIIVADDTAGFGDILVIVELFEGQVGQFPLIFFDVKDVGVGVHIFEPERVQLQ